MTKQAQTRKKKKRKKQTRIVLVEQCSQPKATVSLSYTGSATTAVM
jgi:hypothetical protein